MSPELSAIRKVLDEQPSVRLAYVFGSLAKGSARPDSDADVAVLGSSPLDAATRVALIDALALTTGRAIDLVDLHIAGEPLLGEILRGGIRIKGSDEEHARLITRHIFDTEDFVPYQQRLLRERREAWTG